MAKIIEVTSIEENPGPRQSRTIGLSVDYEDGRNEEIEFPLNLEFERLKINVLWADLKNSRLKGCDFSGSTIRQSGLGDSDFSWCNFQNAKLTYSDISGCDFTGANFIGSSILTISGLAYETTQVAGAIFIGVSMPEGVNEDDVNNLKERGAIVDKNQLRMLLNEMKLLNENSQIDRTKAIQYLSILKNFESIKMKFNDIIINEGDNQDVVRKKLGSSVDNDVVPEVLARDDFEVLREKFGVLMEHGVVSEILEKKEQYFVDHAKKVKAINTASDQKLPFEIMKKIAEFADLSFEKEIVKTDGGQDQDSYKALTRLGMMLFDKAFISPSKSVVVKQTNQLQPDPKLQH